MSIETKSGEKVPASCMDLLTNNQAEYIPYLADLVTYARTQIPFYSRLYSKYTGAIENAAQFMALPYVNESMLIRERLEDMVCNIHAIYEVCYPAGKLRSDCCMPRLQSQQDQEDQYLILEWILEECLGIDLEKESPSIALITNEDNSYWAGVFSKMMILLCNGPFFAMITRDHSPFELLGELSRTNPGLLILSGFIESSSIPGSVKTIIEIGEQPCLLQSDINACCCHVLTHPLLGIIGCSVNQPGIYTYNPDYYYIETSTNGMLVYTSFMQKYMPMIRIRTRHWGKVLQPGLIEINYRGTH